MAVTAAPQGFREARAPISRVRVTSFPWNIPFRSSFSAAQRAGVRYEELVREHLLLLFKGDYRPSPQIRFTSDGESRMCVPDGVLIREPVAFVFEIKSRHTDQAWWQLRRLYAPVVAELPFIRRVVCIEVCRSFDPAVEWPEEFTRCYDLPFFVSDPWKDLGVFVWNPKD